VTEHAVRRDPGPHLPAFFTTDSDSPAARSSCCGRCHPMSLSPVTASRSEARLPGPWSSHSRAADPRSRSSPGTDATVEVYAAVLLQAAEPSCRKIAAPNPEMHPTAAPG
jgi:hypothetical protein